MTARPPMEQIEDAWQRVFRAGYDHRDRSHVLSIISALRAACERVEHQAGWCSDDKLRAALLDKLHGTPAYLADAASEIAFFFDAWDDQRGDRQREAEDNKAADAADARLTW